MSEDLAQVVSQNKELTFICVECMQSYRARGYRWTGTDRHVRCRRCESKTNGEETSFEAHEWTEQELIDEQQTTRLWTNVAAQLIGSLTPSDIQNLSAADRVKLGALALDKAQLLQGKPTERTETGPPPDRDVILAKLQEELERRGLFDRRAMKVVNAKALATSSSS